VTDEREETKLPKIVRRVGGLFAVVLAVTSCGSWRGIANVPLPGGPGTGSAHRTVYLQVPNTLALNVNSRVRVADVYVGRVAKIELKNWIPTLTLDLEPGVALPANVTASIGQTSLLGSQHVELAAPPKPSAQPLRDGDVIPLANSSAFPTTERTLASVAMVLRGGGVTNLETIQNEVSDLLSGRAEAIRDFLSQLDTFTAELNKQRDNINRAIDSTDRLLGIVAGADDTVDHVLTELPPLVEHFDDKKDLFADAVTALGRLSDVTGRAITDSRESLKENLQLLQRPLTQLGRATPYLIGALRLVLTAPFNIDDVPKVVRGDYVNISGTFDFTLSSFDNGLLTGTGFSGALRALEQAWGRDPATMIPDVRYTPNPADLPPERGE
jgi:phospholipid/cholesterol/gamma-HCH transport system substrate-binding protein